ncbi:MAG: peptidoglycan glycosyltransferase FtsW [Planctomycetota bacterium]|jgi:cell division protein FtsW
MLDAALTERRTPAARADLGAGAASPWQRASVRLTCIVFTLACLGLVIVASAAAGRDFAGATLKRLALTGLGAGAFALGAGVPYQWWRRHSPAILGLTLAALAAALIPGVGMTINGARRWVDLGLPVGFQPSEFAKVALCIWVAAYCEKNAPRMRGALHGFLVPLGVVGAAALLIQMEPDFGTAVLTVSVCTAVLLVFGMRLLFLALAAGAGVPILLHKLVLSVPYRLQRLLAYKDPWADPQGSGYQLIQSKIAIGSGGLFGRGLGSGLQKAGFLPGADNDFIFSILGEELGLVGCLAVLALLTFLVWEALGVVLRSRCPFGFALALGLTLLLGMQSAAHIAVVTGSVPTKGLSLPFISAGGSSLLSSMLAAGILVNIARCEQEPDRHELRAWYDDVPGYEQRVRRCAAALAGACLRAARGVHQ